MLVNGNETRIWSLNRSEREKLKQQKCSFCGVSLNAFTDHVHNMTTGRAIKEYALEVINREYKISCIITC
jgi:hypothetical protein